MGQTIQQRQLRVLAEVEKHPPTEKVSKIYQILEEVYNAGYDCGDGFKPKVMLSDLLHKKAQEIELFYTQVHK